METFKPLGAPLVKTAPYTSLQMLGYSCVKSLNVSSLFLFLLRLLSTIQIFQGWNIPALWFQIPMVGFLNLVLQTPEPWNSRLAHSNIYLTSPGMLGKPSQFYRALLASQATMYSQLQEMSLLFASWGLSPCYSVLSTLISKSHLKNIFSIQPLLFTSIVSTLSKTMISPWTTSPAL